MRKLTRVLAAVLFAGTVCLGTVVPAGSATADTGWNGT